MGWGWFFEKVVFDQSLGIIQNYHFKTFESSVFLVKYIGRFGSEERGIVSSLFHQWAKKQAFKEPKRLLEKVTLFVSQLPIIQKKFGD